MGLKQWYQKTFKNSEVANQYYGYSESTPLFNYFGRDIYVSDFVNNAIDRIASEISKLEIKSVYDTQNGVSVLNDDITRLFRYMPNEFQTTSDFLSNVTWLHRKKGNAIIYPKYEWVATARGNLIKRFTAFYPLNPQSMKIGLTESNELEIEMSFADGSRFTLPYSEVIHLKWRRGNNKYLGGDDFGELNTSSMTTTVQSLETLISGLPKAIEASQQIKGVFASSTLVGQTALNKIRDDFETHMFTSKGGIIATDLAGEFTPVRITPAEIPADVLSFLKSNICEKYGVSVEIISGNYSAEEHSAFYQTVLEDFINQFEQAFTARVFTPRELDIGHEIRCYYNKLQKLGMQDIISIASIGTNVGLMSLDEIRDMLGMSPLPLEEGKRRLQSLNYVNVSDVDSYQKGKAGVDDQ